MSCIALNFRDRLLGPPGGVGGWEARLGSARTSAPRSPRSPGSQCERPRLPHRSGQPDGERPVEGGWVRPTFGPKRRSQYFQRSPGAKAGTGRTRPPGATHLAQLFPMSQRPPQLDCKLPGGAGVCAGPHAGRGSVRTPHPVKPKTTACLRHQTALFCRPRFPRLQHEGWDRSFPSGSSGTRNQ